jgi:hypothetical protein
LPILAESASSAGTIMERNGGWAQGQMSQGWAVEILSGEGVPRLVPSRGFSSYLRFPVSVMA